MLYRDFYSELGKLLYAVADVDGVITPQEKEALHVIVKEELVPIEKHIDSFGTNAAYYAEMEFDYLDEKIADTEVAFNSFVDFVEEHHTAIDSKMKETTIRIVKELADAYYKTNRKEKELIAKLVNRMENIN